MWASASLAVMLILAKGGSVWAADTIPVSSCRVGDVDLSGRPPAAAVEAAFRRAFPRAVVSAMPPRHGVTELRFREDGKEILDAYRLAGRSMGVKLFSPRFEVPGGMHPGDTVLSAERLLGRASIDFNPTTDEWDLSFANSRRFYDWPNCSVNFHPSTSRRSSARIAFVTVETPY